MGIYMHGSCCVALRGLVFAEAIWRPFHRASHKCICARRVDMGTTSFYGTCGSSAAPILETGGGGRRRRLLHDSELLLILRVVTHTIPTTGLVKALSSMAPLTVPAPAAAAVKAAPREFALFQQVALAVGAGQL